MGSDLTKLEEISANANLRKYVKHIYIQEDCERMDGLPFGYLPEESPREDPSHIWPRNDAYFVNSDEIGVAKLRTMFLEKRFTPETITVRDIRRGNITACVQPAGALARDILHGADLAAVSVRIYKTSHSSVEAIIDLSPEHQGQGVGFSMLNSAVVIFARNDTSYWSEQLFYNAPNLEDLQVTFETKWSSEKDTMFSARAPIVKLKQVDFVASKLSTQAALTMLANSKHSLTSVSFRLASLSRGSTWRQLLSNIATDFPNLNFFQLKFLLEDASGSIKFQGLNKEQVAEEYRSGLEIFERGPTDKRRISWVRYSGPGAGIILNAVVSSAVYWWVEQLLGATILHSN